MGGEFKLKHQAPFELRAVSKEVWYMYSRGFIKGWAPGKLTGCKDDFAHLVGPSREGFFIKKLSSKCFARL